MTNTPDVLIDAGPIIAFFDGSDAQHECCVARIAQFDGTLLTTTAVLSEVSHILYRRVGIECALACLR